ncbi:hypothetical protein Tco_1195261 [Tanacetum coccineum]
METIHVKFDELTTMASEHNCLEPDTNRFNNDDSSDEFTSTSSNEDLDNFFNLMYEKYFEKRSPYVSINSATQTTLHNNDTPSSSSIITEDNKAPTFVSSSEEKISPISTDDDVESIQEDSADLDGNTLLTSYNSPMFKEAESSSTPKDPSNMHEFNKVQPSTHTWTKAHLLEQVLGDPSKLVMTRNMLYTNVEMCMYALTVSTTKPKNIKEAMSDHSWIESMQDELHQFQWLDV